jgi:hypothetical protein
VDRSAAIGDLAVPVLHDDLIAEVPRRPASGVGDQGLFSRQFQLELIAQEPSQLDLDLLGFSLRSGETKEMVIGVAAVAQPPEVGIAWITNWQTA